MDPIEVVSTVLEQAKAWREASRVLVAVRRINEHDMATLKRVVKDYAAIVALLRHVGEQRMLEDRYGDDVPSVLKSVLERLASQAAKPCVTFPGPRPQGTVWADEVNGEWMAVAGAAGARVAYLFDHHHGQWEPQWESRNDSGAARVFAAWGDSLCSK